MSEYKGIKFTDDDIVTLDGPIYAGEYNPHNVRPWLLYAHHGYCVCVVWASNLQEALDYAVDADKMNQFLISDSELKDYEVDGVYSDVTYLGNASEPFDLSDLGYYELPNPKHSFCALFDAHQQKETKCQERTSDAPAKETLNDGA